MGDEKCIQILGGKSEENINQSVGARTVLTRISKKHIKM
jgi:hypothetical protein